MSGLLISAGCAEGCPPCETSGPCCDYFANFSVNHFDWYEQYSTGIIDLFVDGFYSGLSNGLSWNTEASGSARRSTPVDWTGGTITAETSCTTNESIVGDPGPYPNPYGWIGLSIAVTDDPSADDVEVYRYSYYNGSAPNELEQRAEVYVSGSLVASVDVITALGTSYRTTEWKLRITIDPTTLPNPEVTAEMWDGSSWYQLYNGQHALSFASSGWYTLLGETAANGGITYEDSPWQFYWDHLCVSPCPKEAVFDVCPFWIGDGPHRVLIHSGTIGGESVRLCLTNSGWDTTLESFVWIGTDDFDLTCGNKEIQIRVYCNFLTEESTEREWIVEYENLTDGGTVKLALSITDNDPLASTVSDTLSNFCGGAVTVASVDAAAGPLPNFPCCDLTDSELACLETVPGLSVDESFVISDGDTGNATLTVTGTLAWDEVNGQWGPGDITWSQTGCAFGPIPDTVWEDCTITCDGSGGFTLNVPAPFSLTYNTTGDCGIPISLSFTGVTSVVLCDATTMNVTLDFESV